MKNRQNITEADKIINQSNAFRRGKTDPWITVKNPSKGTNREFIKVRASEYFPSHNKDAKKKKVQL